MILLIDQMMRGPIELLSYGVAMKKDGLAVEGEGVLVQGRPVSPIIVVPSQIQNRWGVPVTLRDEPGEVL